MGSAFISSQNRQEQLQTAELLFGLVSDLSCRKPWPKGEGTRESRSQTRDMAESPGKLKILVVDDEPDVESLLRQRFRRHLRDGAWEFLFAQNGQVALDLLAEHSDVDVILTDLNMPVLDGMALLQELQERELDARAVVVSAYGDVKNLRRAMNRGAFDFLMKPLDMADFEITVNKTAATVARLKESKRRLEEQLKAEASSRAKSQLLAKVSHELRTPLNAIILYSQLLKAEAGDTGAAELVPDLERIEEAAKHLLDLINRVLDFSRIEAGKMDLHPEMFDLKALLNEVVALVTPMVAEAGNHLETDYRDLPARILADPMKLRQCLLNLLSNASKFTRGGSVRLRAFLEGETLVLSVQDSGIGISPQDMSRLFQPFFQGAPARGAGGTGLGLAITKELCELSGGTLSCRSETGQGATFEMRLPLVIPTPI